MDPAGRAHEALAAWIAEHPGHPRVGPAWLVLVELRIHRSLGGAADGDAGLFAAMSLLGRASPGREAELAGVRRFEAFARKLLNDAGGADRVAMLVEPLVGGEAAGRLSADAQLILLRLSAEAAERQAFLSLVARQDLAAIPPDAPLPAELARVLGLYQRIGLLAGSDEGSAARLKMAEQLGRIGYSVEDGRQRRSWIPAPLHWSAGLLRQVALDPALGEPQRRQAVEAITRLLRQWPEEAELTPADVALALLADLPALQAGPRGPLDDLWALRLDALRGAAARAVLAVDRLGRKADPANAAQRLDALADGLISVAAARPESAQTLWPVFGHPLVQGGAEGQARLERVMASLPASVRASARLDVLFSRLDRAEARYRFNVAAGHEAIAPLLPELSLLLADAYRLHHQLADGADALQGPLTPRGRLRTLIADTVRLATTVGQHAEIQTALQTLLQTPPDNQPHPAAALVVQARLASLACDEVERQLRTLAGQHKPDLATLEPLLATALERLADVMGQELAWAGDASLGRGMADFYSRLTVVLVAQDAYDRAIEVQRALIDVSARAPWLHERTESGLSLVEQARLHAASLQLQAHDHEAQAATGQAPAADQGAPQTQLSARQRAAVDVWLAMMAAPQQGFGGQAGPSFSAASKAAYGAALDLLEQLAQKGAWQAGAELVTRLSTRPNPSRTEELQLLSALAILGSLEPAYAQAEIQLLRERLLSVPTPLALWSSHPPGGMAAGPVGFFGAPGPRPEPMDDDSTRGETRPQERARLGRGSADESFARGGGPSDRPSGPPAAQTASGLREEDRRFREDAGQTALAIRTTEQNRAARLAQMEQQLDQMQIRDNIPRQQGQVFLDVPRLSPDELARRDGLIEQAYRILLPLLQQTREPSLQTAAHRAVLQMASHWRTVGQPDRSAAVLALVLRDLPLHTAAPELAVQRARDLLSHAALSDDQPDQSRREAVEALQARFAVARAALQEAATAYADVGRIRSEALQLLAESYRQQARSTTRHSPTQARGMFVRAAREARALYQQMREPEQRERLATMQWNIAEELVLNNHFEEAITVFGELALIGPENPWAQPSIARIAALYRNQLDMPIRATETLMEINYQQARGDPAIQQEIYAIGEGLLRQQRWVETLHVLGVFVDCFPRHEQAGNALVLIGQVHQANSAWERAIAAYDRVLSEYHRSTLVPEARWSIAECTVHLSQWDKAAEAFESFAGLHAADARVAEARRRMGVLKDLARYQVLVDEPNQRKAFDAQFQIAGIVQDQLANPAKAVQEYLKVAAGWPESHLADDALYAAGLLLMDLNQAADARGHLLRVAADYPNSPLADDALFAVGKSYEQQADRLAAMTNPEAMAVANLEAQRVVYGGQQIQTDINRSLNSNRVALARKSGKLDEIELETARAVFNDNVFGNANNLNWSQEAALTRERLSAAMLADRQDRINAARRQAIDAYNKAATLPSADRAGEALLRIASIYSEQLGDPDAALKTWLEIVRQFSGTAVAHDAGWNIATAYQRQRQWQPAVDAYRAFLRAYPRSERAADAQFAVAEACEQLGQWINAMDAYTNYINNYPQAPLVEKAREQINWIRTYRL